MFEALKQPEYTGENRCLPCTVVNTLIALGLGVGAAGGAVAAEAAPVEWAALAGGVVVFVSLALIYFRGYLVPGTPTLTKRYLPARVLRWFGKQPTADAGLADGNAEAVEGEDTIQDVDPEAALQAAGALEPCADREDLCLTDEFREAWNAETETVREQGTSAVDIAERLSLPLADAEIEEHDEARTLKDGERRVGRWPSEAALVADSAAAALLAERYGDWPDLSPTAKGQLLNGLRLFLEDCPTGEGGVEFGEETVESCCGSEEVVAVTCEETGERLFEQPLGG
jgi:hypothetical protein